MVAVADAKTCSACRMAYSSVRLRHVGMGCRKHDLPRRFNRGFRDFGAGMFRMPNKICGIADVRDNNRQPPDLAARLDFLQVGRRKCGQAG
jgi:hypothetical protein